MKATLISSLVIFSLLCTACNRQEGPLEKAGKDVDEAVENIGDGESPFKKKGAGEKAGEAVDKAIDDVTGKDK